MKIEASDLLSGKAARIDIALSSLPQKLIEDLPFMKIFMAPGLTDLQINGYRGLDFNSEDLTIPKIKKATEELLTDGVTCFLPTLVSNDPRLIERNLSLFAQAIKAYPLVESCISGFHLEGPFISKQKGARGAHASRWIQKPDWELIRKWQEISENRIRLITLAPEHEGSERFIRRCVKNNIRVSLGHSAASGADIEKAIHAGARLSSHLGNAMSRTIHRHNNILFKQLAHDELSASIICDGHHLSRDLTRIILRSKGEKTILVSDATMYAGMPPGIYDASIGGSVKLEENRRLSMLNDPEYLAGSASSLLECIKYLIQEKLCSLSEAWEMASQRALKFLYDENIPPAFQNDRVFFTEAPGSIEILFTLKDQTAYVAERWLK